MDDREKYIQDQIAKGSTKGREALGREYDLLLSQGKLPPPTTVPKTTSQAATAVAPEIVAEILNRFSNLGGSTVANKISPSSRGPIGLSGTQYYDPATGQPLGYFGYTALGQQPVYSAGRGGVLKTEVKPHFFEGDEDQIRRQSPEEIGTIQQQLASIGLLSGRYNAGMPDDKTVAAYKTLLGWSNTYGIADPKATIERLKQQGFQGKSAGVTKYVTNAEDLKAVFDKSAQSVLGRTLDEASLSRLVRAYQQEETKPTQNTAVPGTKVKEPTAAVFGQKQITAQNQDEADAYKFAGYAQVLERLLGG